jgi:hypothetical protein
MAVGFAEVHFNGRCLRFSQNDLLQSTSLLGAPAPESQVGCMENAMNARGKIVMLLTRDRLHG